MARTKKQLAVIDAPPTAPVPITTTAHQGQSSLLMGLSSGRKITSRTWGVDWVDNIGGVDADFDNQENDL